MIRGRAHSANHFLLEREAKEGGEGAEPILIQSRDSVSKACHIIEPIRKTTQTLPAQIIVFNLNE